MENATLNQSTLVAMRHVFDFIRSMGGLDKVDITPQLLQYAGNAYRRYNEYLDREREEKIVTEDERGHRNTK